ncbi:aminotransferase class IV [Zavarzinella formosa]|uniref:aminotransferase class IV n=1 Tax=Zavarzinella formosa TaxID=360055 RepID=UPI0003054CEA|nr:aminotransferase class IV [Zavarzinella formosa]
MVELDDWWWAETPMGDRIRIDPVGVLADRGVNIPPGTPDTTIREVLRIVSLLWVDGRIIPLEHFYIDPADEGLLFGRGVWESTRTQDGVPWLWPWHLDRLRKTAAVLGINIAPERLPNANQVAEYVRTLTSQDVVIRLNATAGRPGMPGMVWMSAALQQIPPASISLQTCPNPVQKGQPYLLWKTFQYATRLRVGQQATQAGYDSALLLDADGNLQEASHANIFIRLPEGWATPTANGGLLPGTVRQFLLQQSPLPIREQLIPVELIEQASEVFVTNSNMGIVPVTQIDRYTYPVGAETTALMNWLTPTTPAGNQLRFVERRTPMR